MIFADLFQMKDSRINRFLTGHKALELKEALHLFKWCTKDISLNHKFACVVSSDRKELFEELSNSNYNYDGDFYKKEKTEVRELDISFGPDYTAGVEERNAPKRITEASSVFSKKKSYQISDPFPDINTATCPCSILNESKLASNKADLILRKTVLQMILDSISPDLSVEKDLNKIKALFKLKTSESLTSTELKAFLDGEVYLKTELVIQIKKKMSEN